MTLKPNFPLSSEDKALGKEAEKAHKAKKKADADILTDANFSKEQAQAIMRLIGRA